MYIHTCIRAYIRAYALHTHTCIHTYTHTRHTQTLMHTRMCAHTHTHMHTYKQFPWLQSMDYYNNQVMQLILATSADILMALHYITQLLVTKLLVISLWFYDLWIKPNFT